MKASICCISYNHGKFIGQSLNSFLSQKTDFAYEIIISDDSSNDDTGRVIEEFMSANPGRITLFKNDVNIGMAKNFEKAIRACKGEYIALCEGDDFWCNDDKLQKQVDFLSANKDFAICFHNARILKDHVPNEVGFSNSESQKEVSTFSDLALGEFIYTPTCMFRRKDFEKFSPRYAKYLNNYTLDLHNAQFGKIKYFNEVMSVYRIHPGGVWSMVRREQTLINQLPAYKFYLKYFDEKYKKYFIRHLKMMTEELISLKISNNDYKDFWRFYKDYIIYNMANKNEIKKAISIFVKANYYIIKAKLQNSEGGKSLPSTRN